MKKYNNKGIAIFVTIALLFLLSLAAIAVLLTAYNYNNICEGQIRRIKAITSAEAGINYVYHQLRTNEAAFVNAYKVPPGTAYAFPSPVINGITNLEVWVEDRDPPIAGTYIIKSRATYQKSSTQ
ncbi:MAG: hypothetical protein NTX47_05930 [Candidatus Omnitrophica bacterium]|nr:hypothetical protein [Candidatus Omnitrophota bacterium]